MLYIIYIDGDGKFQLMQAFTHMNDDTKKFTEALKSTGRHNQQRRMMIENRRCQSYGSSYMCNHGTSTVKRRWCEGADMSGSGFPVNQQWEELERYGNLVSSSGHEEPYEVRVSRTVL
ncbi:MAG: hypothetical protein COS35_04720 [Zetaproteobacteria bacterium CG02_land_8_20_14_3_00_50_9]|nr:MAG: hypothetical protein COW62_03495 [Zetaproteobacteria bacterium CG17_big_fil_post_rev_8_21_14_2_50_50_13]PIV30808.1 MAG: hypothetical protein COS35_04720 [Zetaproteobacteria bacterium CG02_land_8_20_14_3_00_50_9]PIY56607.1 MAG: hypothetical protein COZ00_03300 [Zetaproteobacteria bacterium CG_4_10_14_0_8_um_filter_49_80]